MEWDGIGAEEDPICQNPCNTGEDSCLFLQLVSAKQDKLSANSDWRG